MRDIERRIQHTFGSGVLYTGVDHFLAMFPATVLVPVLINNKFNASIIDISLVLLASGCGTLLFLFLTRGRIPAYLGSSFAYIGLTIYLISSVAAEEKISPSDAYLYIVWGYLFAALLFLLFSLAYRFKKTTSLIAFLLPNSIIGPAISLIGLELASVAAIDAGFNLPQDDPMKLNSMLVALITLGVIVLASITRRRFFKNASIVIGMIVGYLASIFLGVGGAIDLASVPVWSFPRINLLHSFPPHFLQLFIAIIPATVVVFTEHISRITVIRQMQMSYDSSQANSNNYNDSVESSLSGHAASIALSAIIGSVPTTIYAENIAVMSVTSANAKKRENIQDGDPVITGVYNPLHFAPYIFSAVIAIAVSFLYSVQYFLMNMPKPIIGGMELFLFGIIVAPGVQLLVETGVNFRKLTNQMITASVLVAGVSGFSFDFGIVELKGMSLGLVIGVMLNLLFRGLAWLGWLNERVTFAEALELCLSDTTDKKKILKLYTSSDEQSDEQQYLVNDIHISSVSSRDILDILRGQYLKDSRVIIKRDLINSNLNYAEKAEIANNLNYVFVSVILKTDGTHLYVKIPIEKANMWSHDYPQSFSDATDGYFNIYLDGKIPTRKIKEILKDAFNHAVPPAGPSQE